MVELITHGTIPEPQSLSKTPVSSGLTPVFLHNPFAFLFFMLPMASNPGRCLIATITTKHPPGLGTPSRISRPPSDS
jgi:hypothetical protein